MMIDQRMLRRHRVALRTRRFVILSGLSATGKTWVTELYDDAVKARRLLAAVAPNWTANEDLLGYYNPVDGTYHHMSVSRFLVEAEAAYEDAQARVVQPVPYHVALDKIQDAVLFRCPPFRGNAESIKTETGSTR